MPGSHPGRRQSNMNSTLILPRTGGERKPFRAWLPDNLDLKTIVSSAGHPDWYAYAAWAVSTVVMRRYVDLGVDEHTFVPLAAEYMTRFVPRDVRRPLLDILLDGLRPRSRTEE